MSTLRTNAILDSTGGSTATINGVLLRPGILDPENRIINGAFDFWQRGTSHSTIGFGSADRWAQFLAGGTATMSRQGFPAGFTIGSNNPSFYLSQSVSGQTLASHYAQVVQLIEGVRSYAGQTITVLGWARRTSGSGNLAVEAIQSFGTGGSPSANVTGTGQTVTLTGSFAPFAVTISVPSITGKTIGTNGNDYLALIFWTSAGSDFNSRTNSLGLQTIGVDLWGIHIKLGTHTTAATDLYKAPELGPELARCERYYWFRNGIISGEYAAGGIAYDVQFPTTMRTSSPSVSFTSTNGVFSTQVVGNRGAYFYYTGTSFGTGNIIVDAEL